MFYKQWFISNKFHTSFFSKELDKLRNSLSKEEMRQFYEVAYATHLKEKQQKEETRQLIKLKHEKKNET